MSAKKDFTGPFAPLCVKYVELKQAAGYDFKQQSRLLRCFDDFCKAYKIENYSITEDIAIAWSKQRPNESEVYRNSRIGVMQRFSQFLCMQGYPSYFLPSLPRAHSNHTPHIFTYDELHRIFYRLDDMQTTSAAPFRNLVMPVLIRLLYCTGVRIMEALKLQLKHVDLVNGTLMIEAAKFNKDRLIPVSASMLEILKQYCSVMHPKYNTEEYLFIGITREPCSHHNVYLRFRELLVSAGIQHAGRGYGPRIHDIRHTHCCHVLQKASGTGMDLTNMLPALSVYMGHESITATSQYLKMTAEVYPEILDTVEALCAQVIPEVGL